MQGHGYPQPAKPPPPTGALVLVRVLFVGISVFCIGFLAWTMLLRLAIVTRKSLDWGLFVAALAADVLSVVLLGSEPGEDVHTAGGYLGITLLLGTLVASIAYYLAADIRHFQQLREGAYGGQPAPAYGYPQPARPAQPPSYTATTSPQHTPPPMPHTPVPQQHTPPPMPHTPVPQPPMNTPPPQRPAPARIDQVRAELDELSDYLRKHDEGGK
ncbi:hypothetical protein [Streptomyces sp. NBC_00986]|uniref:hypothetical protein n=1 Tax=Streptomyces sp. NBC_00986 TaxID=2903702 RepID=UPI003869E80C|nr:hypothetical protein OG504_31480 [Streptomyces sp. NBC_00986]